VSSRRQDVQKVAPGPGSNAGLWLDRWLGDSGDRGTGKQAHLLETIGTIRVPAAYERWYERWKELVASCPPATATAEVEVEGRLAIGLGAESVLETAITLHRSFGVPYLPGPALKGLAATAARHGSDDAWHPKADGTDSAYRTLFGDTETSGHVTFHDGVWIPNGTGLPLDLDVMTVHHPDYYQTGDAPPAEWDDPNPVSFLSARGRYLLAVSGPKRWADRALEILVGALAAEGIGAKTGAGYGRLKLVSGGTASMAARASNLPPWPPQVKRLNLGNVGTEVPRLLREYVGEAPAVAKAIVEQLGRRAYRDALGNEKNWALLIRDAEDRQ
jgi:CRISPR-associated protein Cmr6